MIQRAVESLNLPGRYHFVIRKDSYYDQVCSLLHKILPDPKIISVEETTEGPAASCLLFKDFINSEEELVVVNCDQIMWYNVVKLNNIELKRHHWKWKYFYLPYLYDVDGRSSYSCGTGISGEE